MLTKPPIPSNCRDCWSVRRVKYMWWNMELNQVVSGQLCDLMVNYIEIPDLPINPVFLYCDTPGTTLKMSLRTVKLSLNKSLKSAWIFLETWGRFKNTYELLNLRAFKFSPLDKIYIFQCMGKIFCVQFQRYIPFEILHKISYPYIERYDFYATLK